MLTSEGGFNRDPISSRNGSLHVICPLSRVGYVVKQKHTDSTPTTQHVVIKYKGNVIKLRQLESLCNERGKIFNADDDSLLV
jgi:hypothetical protein